MKETADLPEPKARPGGQGQVQPRGRSCSRQAAPAWSECLKGHPCSQAHLAMARSGSSHSDTNCSHCFPSARYGPGQPRMLDRNLNLNLWDSHHLHFTTERNRTPKCWVTWPGSQSPHICPARKPVTSPVVLSCAQGKRSTGLDAALILLCLTW